MSSSSHHHDSSDKMMVIGDEVSTSPRHGLIPLPEEEARLSPTGEVDFLAAYGLELDEEEEEEEHDDSGPKRPARRTRAKRSGSILKMAFSTPPLLNSALPSSSPHGQRKASWAPGASPGSTPSGQRKASWVGLVKNRSASVTSDHSYKPLPTTPRASPSNLSNNASGYRPRTSSRSNVLANVPYKDYSQLVSYKDYSQGIGLTLSPPVSQSPLVSQSPALSQSTRQSFMDDLWDDEDTGVHSDDASSVSHFAPSILLNPKYQRQHHQEQQGKENVADGADSSQSSHTTQFDDACSDEQDSPDSSKHSDSASSFDEEESWDSRTSKAKALFLSSTLPQMPYVQPITVGMAEVSPTTMQPRLPPRRPASSSSSSVQESPISPINTKEEAKKVATEKKVALKQEKLTREIQESKKKREERERKVLLKSYDELEVERFLADFGKHVTKVRSTGPAIDPSLAAASWPKKEDWTNSDTGAVNVSGYSMARLVHIASYLSPSRLVGATSISNASDLQEAMPEENFRIAALRGNAERLYMTALPMYEGIFVKLRTVWRWDSKIKTALWSTLYFTLWFNGWLFSGLFALIILNVLRIRVFPPKPESLREMLRKQHQRSRELQQAKAAKAEDVIQQAQENDDVSSQSNDGEAAPATTKKRSRYGLAADATRKYGKAATMLTSALADVHERIKNFIMWKSIPATWRAIGLLFVAMIGCFFSSPWMMARLPGLALGISLFVVAPIAEHRPEWMGVEWNNPFDVLLAGVPNDAQYAMQVLRKRAAAGEALTGDKDVAGWMNEEDEAQESLSFDETLLPAMSGLEGMDRSTAVSTAMDQAALSGSSSVNWNKWKSRVAKGREMAVAGSEMLSGQRPVQLPRIAGGEQTVNSQEALTAKMMLGMTKGINWGLDSLQNTSNRKLMQRRLEPDEEISDSDGVYWAVYLGSCGHVVVTPERIRFRSLFARKLPTDAEEQPVMDPITGECQVTEAQLQNATVRTLLNVELKDVMQLSKTRAVNVGVWGIDGLEVRTKGGKAHQFSSIVKRDEAFNRILALAPQNWTK